MAQKPVKIDDERGHKIFSFAEIETFEDPSAKLSLQDVLSDYNQKRFAPSKNYVPKNEKIKSAYWYRFTIDHNNTSEKQWVLEFFDQSIRDLQLYVPNNNHQFKAHYFGTNYKFINREFAHKNFVYSLDNSISGKHTYYLRIQSPQSVSAIVVLRDLKWFVGYALNEYFLFGLFYGMILVFCLYNLLMFFALKRQQYLYYVLYNLSIGLYEMCNDGVAFQYLWPNSPVINGYGFGVALYLSAVFGLLFTIKFLYLKYKAPKVYLLLCIMIGLRTAFFILCLFLPSLFNFKVIEILPLMLAFYAAVYVYKRKYAPALFLVIGYSFLLLGFGLKILLLFKLLPYNLFTYYSLSFCFLMEMILMSFAIGSSIRSFRKKKNKAQKRIIQTLQLNQELNMTLNSELNVKVDEATSEIREKASIIARQNKEISDMNALLRKDNKELHLNIEKVNHARVMSKFVDFDDFCKVYPDKESCFKYISDLKWEKDYQCKKCSNTHYLNGKTLYSRRCTKCGYDESVIANTFFQNSRIPINKALYMLFLVHSSKGTISSRKLSSILNIRQSTCWIYNSRIQKLIVEYPLGNKGNNGEAWSRLLLERPVVFSNVA